MHQYQSMWYCTSCYKSQTIFCPVQYHRWLIAPPPLSFFFILTCSFFLTSLFYSPWISQHTLLGKVCCVLCNSDHSVFNKSAHMTIPLLIKKQIFTYLFFFFCSWLTLFSIFKFYFALFLPTMTINPIFYDKWKPSIDTLYNYLLTIKFYFHCAIWCCSYSIVCCTAIRSTVISVGFKDKLIPSSQYTAVTFISIYFDPGDVWCWFTICDTL